MVIFGPRAGFALCATALVSCTGSEPQPSIDAVEPSSAYADRDVRLTLIGAGFIPSFRLDPTSTERVAIMDGFSGQVGDQPLTDFGWVSPTQISATLTSTVAMRLPFGLYQVEITDPRGRKAMAASGFTELGVDKKAPNLDVEGPAAGENYWPGATIHAKVTATEQSPGYITALAWQYSEGEGAPPSRTGVCPFEAGSSQVDCTFDIRISSDLSFDAKVRLDVSADDDAVPPNNAQWGLTIQLHAPPNIDSVTPNFGGVAGGTSVVVGGSGFQSDSRVYFIDEGSDTTDLLVFDGGLVSEDGTTISGYAPPHAAGSVTVLVRSAQGDVSKAKAFAYRNPPQIISIDPSSGRPDQDTAVHVYGTNFNQATLVYLGESLADGILLVDPRWQSPTEISGTVPGSRGTVTVWALDPSNGWTSLPNGFSWSAP